MGSPVGVFTEEEVKELTSNEKKLLKEHIVQHMQTSPEVGRILSGNPKILTGNKKIRTVLRRKANKLRNRLRKKK